MKILKAVLGLSGIFCDLRLAQSASDSNSTPSEINHYYVQGRKIELERDPKRFVMKPSTETSAQTLESKIRSQLNPKEIQHIGFDALEIQLVEATAPSKLLTLRDNLTQWIQPVFTYEGKSIYPNGELFVQLKSGATPSALSELIQEFGLELHNNLEQFPSVLRITLPQNSNADILEVVARFQSLSQIEFAEPNLFFLDTAQYAPNDSFYSHQWALHNTGQGQGTPGADIHVEGAWDITRGRTDVWIAILDTGVSVAHPDLQENMLPGADFTDRSPPGNIPGNAECGDYHGTACAGIAAGMHDNNFGVSGVAPFCKILPIRTLYNQNGNTVGNLEWLANGINWAWQHGADVLSMSIACPESNLINLAIENASLHGRSGLGSILLAAAGNDTRPGGMGLPCSYPARHDFVIAVGASDPCDNRKTYLSPCDDEANWSSNLYPEVLAPGVGIYTTNNHPLTCGSTIWDFRENFNGTSAACPHAAGVMALILSANPGLPGEEARQILWRTANSDIGDPQERSFPFIGFGRIDAYQAVYEASQCLPLSNPTVVYINNDVSLVCTNGSQSRPFYSFDEGTSTVLTGGRIRLQYNPDPYSFYWIENPSQRVINRAMTLEAVGGTIQISLLPE